MATENDSTTPTALLAPSQIVDSARHASQNRSDRKSVRVSQSPTFCRWRRTTPPAAASTQQQQYEGWETDEEDSSSSSSEEQHVNDSMGNLSSQQGDKKGRRGRAMAPRPVLNSGSEKRRTQTERQEAVSTRTGHFICKTQIRCRRRIPLRVLEVPCPALFTWTLTVTYRHPMRQERMTQLWKDSQVLDDGTATLQDASPGSLSDITVFCDEAKQDAMSNVMKRPTQSLPCTPATDTHSESSFSTMGFPTIYESRYREAESSSYSSGGRDLSTSSSSSSMDIHDLTGHFRQQRGSLDSPPPCLLP
ncbi:uncharacterized protein CEXT_598931 [Caerostris extrusa]|uniref:Uncharacterized protein n=1 Tax=Caerostris extrusa TaxID=172846 RepID=A0AAV4YFF9_CAEEX|nr:uncharacterized protein CEXT_598931 [Caerostris extrusa]